VLFFHLEDNGCFFPSFENIPGKISFTIDGWTSPNCKAFLGITAHWINRRWKMEELLIDFVPLTGPHSGENLAVAFEKATCELGILTKVRLLLLL